MHAGKGDGLVTPLSCDDDWGFFFLRHLGRDSEEKGLLARSRVRQV